jgi:uncharacterized phage protein gp47/JayE
MLIPPTQEELFARFRSAMEAVGLTHWSQGSRIGAMGRVQAAYVEELWQSLAQTESNLNPSTARGLYLDRMGNQFGVKRLGALTAGTLGQGPSVQFTNNGGTQLTVPGGTRVWSTQSPELAFFTVQDLTLSGGAQGFVDVMAGAAGDLHNVGANTLNAHNAGMNQLTVVNVRPIGGGTLPESDASYRFRISQAMMSRSGQTSIALQQALLKLPGVREVLIRSGARGSGTLDVILVPIDRVPSQALLSAAEQEVDLNVAAGISWRLLTPIVRRVDLDIQLQMKSGTTVASVKAAVDGAARAYMDNLRVDDGLGGSTLIYNELISRIMDAHIDILDVSVSLSLDGERTLQTNIPTRAGERLVSGSIGIN